MIAKYLNEHCACRTLDTNLLRSKLESDELLKGMYSNITEGHPNLFSATTVFISSEQLKAMTSIINAIEETIQTPQYKSISLNRSSEIAKTHKGPRGAFMGYDFHLSEDGPKLIEINTNAGGALLNLELARAQQECCQEMNIYLNFQEELSTLDKSFYEMFKSEWKAQRGDLPMGVIAIVDDNPPEQYLYPEFQLFQRLISKFGGKAVIADAKDLQFKEGKLWLDGERIDLVYNRLTDFYLEDESHAALKSAYEQDAIVLTPAPYHHALYANKLNLVTLSNEALLSSLSIPQPTKEILLTGIPTTEEVLPSKADDLWERRRSLFFKPVSGFGSKATYRGDKITRKVWNDILQGQYVAQALIAPSKRLVQQESEQTDLKLDIRAYVYEGKIQIIAARLYSGQTTNFRTSGGGFAPVFVIQNPKEVICKL
jgi:hypothetical protein